MLFIADDAGLSVCVTRVRACSRAVPSPAQGAGPRPAVGAVLVCLFYTKSQEGNILRKKNHI